MKKGFLVLAAGLVMVSSAMAQKDKKKLKEASPVVTTATVAPKAEVAVEQTEKKAEVTDALFVKEATHDFGKIAQGKPVTTEFDFKNTSKDSLKLDMVQAGCGCTTPVWKPGPYAPGEVFRITVGYNASAEGAFNKPVTITYNGQQKVIYITGTVFATPSTPAPENKGVSKVQM